ncbi:MAG TPA: SHOCT domain-containing protein [Candidatus Angelobacter sp.]|jgi:putative membrane protein|nr:SHOCT domain-containing protein [Candidatus Angelobacter sp.]
MRPGPFGDGYYGGGDAWQRWLFLLLIVIALVAGTVLLARMFLANPPRLGRQAPPPPHNPALTELDLRYARGEVSREEYLQRRADLLGHVGPPPTTPGT